MSEAALPDEAEHTPVQRETLERLAARREDRPVFPDDLRARLRRDLEGELSGPATAIPDGESLFVNKHALATIHGCEARWRSDATTSDFVPSPAVVQGAVAHKAIELTLNRRSPSTPAELVDTAIERLAGADRWMSDWLRDCDEDDRAEVRGAAVARVTSFTEVWPPLKPVWRPVTEQSLRTELCGGRVVLSGRVDLALGKADGMRAGKVVVDFKTGSTAVHHLDDLRFYALVETLRTGVPPRAVASSYLDSGSLHVEAVTEGMLEAAAARVADGVERMVGVLHGGDEPVLRPSGACRWCRELEGCTVGQAFLDDRDRA
ncbi:PD-(D/E)XK nuclease family protein [Iamia majanohamensis]|uniref:PD-(D/E)XK nuclease family protein n=1 Tax=Iamia majanohamensis TaxID=467976 RepID=A0AAF0BX90_9ACTN|nr:PD-(D/E)XK nuclease family protein [Iamia majanohamensis]WCO68439.1 PD-(D/E)XK nuclease family protein [Iamia majanohamensis]